MATARAAAPSPTRTQAHEGSPPLPELLLPPEAGATCTLVVPLLTVSGRVTVLVFVSAVVSVVVEVVGLVTVDVSVVVDVLVVCAVELLLAVAAAATLASSSVIRTVAAPAGAIRRSRRGGGKRNTQHTISAAPRLDKPARLPLTVWRTRT
jgi:hypothetical protein